MLNTFDYIKCFENTFWEWDFRDECLHLKDGITFAHWEEVKEYLINLEPMGLPLFDVFAGIMAATKSDAFGSVGLSIQKYLTPTKYSESLQPSLAIFETIEAVDQKYKQGANRFLLIATVLEKSNAKLIDSVSAKIAYELGNPELSFFGAKGNEAVHHLKKVVSIFRSLSNHFPDPESIVTAMMGFDVSKVNLLNAIPLAQESMQDPLTETFLDQLKNEIRTEKIAALIPYMISGMNFPIHSKQSDERPDGGVSNLSNKGHFDQLIVSEFAYDDDYFLSRIVNNEALFFEREKAKDDNNDDVCLLIDSSLYTWGLPKLIAIAAGCAITMKTEDTEIDSFVVGSEVISCNFNSVHGVLQGIRYTDASICPAQGINLFTQKDRSYSNTLFITTEKSWKRPEMIHIREESNQLFDFVVFTNEDAEINVLKSKGKQVANFKLDVETIWELKKNDVPRKHVAPAQTTQYPLLFPILNGRIKYFFRYNEDTFFIDKSKGVFHVQINKNDDGNPRGARFLMKIGYGLDVLGDIGLNARGEFELLMFSRKSKQIIIYNLSLITAKVIEFTQWKNRMGDFFYHQNNRFMFAGRDGHFIIDDDFTASSQKLPFEIELYRTASERRRLIKTKQTYWFNYFKMIKSAYVTDQGELVIRGKRIEATVDFIRCFDPPVGKPVHIPAFTGSGERQFFTFSSGDSISSNPSGMVEFHFNEKNRPRGYELSLVQVGGEKIPTVKQIRVITGKALNDCKEMVDEGKGKVIISHDENKLNRMAHDLREIGNKVEVRPLQLGIKFYMTSVVDLSSSMASTTFFSGNKIFKDDEFGISQRDITPIEFYDLYVRAFIQNISNGI